MAPMPGPGGPARQGLTVRSGAMSDAAAPPAAPAADGPGYHATVWTLALGQVLNWAVLFYTFSALVLPMDRQLGWGRPVLMGAFTLGLLVSGLSSYLAGAAIDRGHGRAVMISGTALAALGVAGWALVTAPWQFYAVWAVLGAASAMCLYEPAFAVLTKRYPTRYREGITTLTLVGGFASTICFPAVAALTAAGLDWRQTLWVLAAVMVAMVPLHAWALRGPMLVAGPAHEDPEADATLHEALRHAGFWLLTLCFTLYAFAQAALWAHVMPAFDDMGVAHDDALWVLGAIGPAQVAGRLAYARFGRGWSLRRLGALVLAAMPVSMVLLATGRGLAALLVFAVVFGLANGLITIVRGGLIPEYFGRSHVGRIGGVMSGVGQIARAAAPVSAALLVAGLGGYRALIWALGGLGVVAVLAFWAARPTR